MPRLLVLLLAPTLVFAAPQPVIALLPASSNSAELTRLALLMEARASMLVDGSATYTSLDLKQVLAMAAQEGLEADHLSDDTVADQALVLLGADRVVAVALDEKPDGYLVRGSVRDGTNPTAFSAKVPKDWSAAVTQGSVAIANALLSQDKASVAADAKAQPESRSASALKSLGRCWEIALRQPMGIESPVGLSEEDLTAAMSACKTALTADASLRFAKVTLGLLQAIRRDDAEAEKNLGSTGDSDPALVPWALARFWLLTRSQSNEAGVSFLQSVIKKHPGQLMIRSYLANTLAAMNQHPRAVTAWHEYLALAPRSAFAQGRLSRSLARLSQNDAALAAVKRALELNPNSREAKLQLASRQIDSGQLEAARATLDPIVAEKNASAEAVLRLGWANWLAGDVESASALFKTAIDRSTGPRGWKTKGRAFYNLALAEVKQGRLEPAKAAYAKSLETGFVMTPPDPLLAEVIKANAAPKALAIKPAAGSLYVMLDATIDKQAVLQGPEKPLVDSLMRAKLTSYGAVFAPPDEDKKAAIALIRANALKSYALRAKVTPEGESGLGIELLVLSYPEMALRGAWSAKASGGDHEALIEALVPRVVDDTALDLEWK